MSYLSGHPKQGGLFIFSVEVSMFPYGTRVFVKPVSAQVRVQRAEGLYGQFLPSGGQEVLWDSSSTRGS